MKSLTGYVVQTWSGNYNSANRDAMLSMRTGHYIGIPISRVSVFLSVLVFALFSRLTQLVTLIKLISVLRLGNQPRLVLHGKQLWLARMAGTDCLRQSLKHQQRDQMVKLVM